MSTMSILSANNTITMTAADLLTFCQQMMMTMYQNSDSNDSETSIDILTDMKMIDETDILMKNQQVLSEELTALENEC
ncbi:uncharacterized protein BDCG_17371 [Blastomyces dermatitidis ER-3]|uniref:Uncharacterized protein n=1 Tax=Ajellomyces dermatitidis (strain ER-3 / ATCC MYA-2586) TaxID=559297 RepID=A0ABX2VY52_AJEDR|nr:uncharacterized protein BDCG_17371 [Blastomyces dermatitidis ER-3]OAT02076.1 hypothetical protein BDCG_17371 [Blastomyces dermatitidis ER-3]